jgi:hypothetical protein
LLGSTNGAQRASRRSLTRPVTGFLLTVTFLGSLAAAPSVGATNGTVLTEVARSDHHEPADRPGLSIQRLSG